MEATGLGTETPMNQCFYIGGLKLLYSDTSYLTFTSLSKGCVLYTKIIPSYSSSLRGWWNILNTNFSTLTLVNSYQIYHIIYFATSPSCCTSHLSPWQGLVSRSWAGGYPRGANGIERVSSKEHKPSWDLDVEPLFGYRVSWQDVLAHVFFSAGSHEETEVLSKYILFLRLSTQPSTFGQIYLLFIFFFIYCDSACLPKDIQALVSVSSLSLTTCPKKTNYELPEQHANNLEPCLVWHTLQDMFSHLDDMHVGIM